MILSLNYTGHGSNYTATILEQLANLGLGNITFENFLFLSCRKRLIADRIEFDVQFINHVGCKGIAVYQFHVYIDGSIKEDNIPATEQQAKEVLELAYKHLKEQWEIRRETEVNIFPSLLPLTDEQVEIFVAHLIQNLNEPPKQLTKE